MNRFLDRHGILDADYERAAKDDATFEALLLPDRKPTPLAGNALVVVDSSDAPAAALATPQEASSRRLARSAKRADHRALPHDRRCRRLPASAKLAGASERT